MATETAPRAYGGIKAVRNVPSSRSTAADGSVIVTPFVAQKNTCQDELVGRLMTTYHLQGCPYGATRQSGVVDAAPLGSRHLGALSVTMMRSAGSGAARGRSGPGGIRVGSSCGHPLPPGLAVPGRAWNASRAGGRRVPPRCRA
ncbi:hypothetical protein GCM10020254_04600 [Streptomyces goshikiensis]